MAIHCILLKLQKVQWHFVHSCKVSNYTEEISAMSQPSIHLVANEHLQTLLLSFFEMQITRFQTQRCTIQLQLSS